MMNIKCAKAIGTFVGGVLFGTAGIAILKSKDAKKAYTHCTAAVLRGKDSVMKTASVLKENCADIYADAEDINEKRYEEAEAEKVAAARAIVEEYDKKEQAE
jgi:hypothetical protein